MECVLQTYFTCGTSILIFDDSISEWHLLSTTSGMKTAVRKQHRVLLKLCSDPGTQRTRHWWPGWLVARSSCSSWRLQLRLRSESGRPRLILFTVLSEEIILRTIVLESSTTLVRPRDWEGKSSAHGTEAAAPPSTTNITIWKSDGINRLALFSQSQTKTRSLGPLSNRTRPRDPWWKKVGEWGLMGGNLYSDYHDRFLRLLVRLFGLHFNRAYSLFSSVSFISFSLIDVV